MESALDLEDCKKCGLHRFRRKVVPGRGMLPADILFIGEAPGKSEDMLGEAFVGAAGHLLDKMMEAAWKLSETQHRPTYYITNTVLCRPCSSKNGDNREPNREEVLACTPNVMQIINRVNQKEVVCLGRISERYFKSEFPEYTQIMHPSRICQTGEENSPYYLPNVRRLAEVFRRMSNV